MRYILYQLTKILSRFMIKKKRMLDSFDIKSHNIAFINFINKIK